MHSKIGRQLACGSMAILVGSACTGKLGEATPSGGEAGASAPAPPTSCPAVSASYPSLDAVEVGRCRGVLSSNSALVGVASYAPVDSIGSASAWNITFLEAGTALQWSTSQTEAGAVVCPFAEPKPMECAGIQSMPSSAVVVPDALARLATRGIHAETEIGFRASADCPPLERTAGIDVSVGLHVPNGSRFPAEWWDVYYDTSGVFLRVCGPCPKRADKACASCSAQ